MNRNYAALRLWSTVLIVIGVVGVIFVVIGTIVAMIEAVTFLQALAIRRRSPGRAFRKLAYRSGAGLESTRRRG